MLIFSQNAETKSFRRGLSLVSALVLGLSMSFSSAYVEAAGNTATANAEVMTPITIEIMDFTALNFGKVAPTGAVGTVTVSPFGARTAEAVALMPSSVASSALRLLVQGEPSQNFVLDAPAGATVSTDAEGGDIMSIDLSAFPISAAAVPGSIPTTHSLSDGGQAFVAVGGTLNVAANQTPGNYSGTFNITVAYQ